MQVFSRLETTLAISRRIDSPAFVGNSARAELRETALFNGDTREDVVLLSLLCLHSEYLINGF